MTAKPHRLHQIFAASVLSYAKKPRMMSTNSAMNEEFAKHAEYLNQLNDKRERVVKASRDVTINSKKVIFQVHRANKDNREEVLSRAEKDLAAVTDQFVARVVKELQGTDFWKLRRAYTFAIQEYVEAATFCRFCRSGSLLDLNEINATLLPLSDQYDEPLQINPLDYLLGLADLTGELMRLAIGRISDGEVEYAEKICRFVQDIYRELTLLAPIMDDNADMKKKMETMLQSVMKIENALHTGSTLIEMKTRTKRLKTAVQAPTKTTSNISKAIIVSPLRSTDATTQATTSQVPVTELVPRNVELLSLTINPDYQQRLINSGEVGFERPASRRVPTACFYEIELASFKQAMLNILTDFLTCKLYEQGKLTSAEIDAEVTSMAPIIVDACVTALYSKMHTIHRQYGRYMQRFTNPPTYARDIELPLPLADAIQNFGVFEPQNVLTNFVYVPVYPEGIQNEGRSTQECNSYKYEAYVPILKSLGVPVKSVDTLSKAGSSWWLFQVKMVHNHFDLACIFPPSNYSDHAILTATMFILLNDDRNGIQPIIKYQKDDVLYGYRAREVTAGFNLRAFAALCHTPKQEWSLTLLNL